MNERISKLLWPLGVGMLTGWVCQYLFLVYVLTRGGKIVGWHAGLWVAATFVGTMLVQGWKGGKVQGDRANVKSGRRKSEKDGQTGSSNILPSFGSRLLRLFALSAALTLAGIALPLLFSFVLSHFTDFSWDGMTSRGITVRNLMKGDPALNAYPFGHVLAGFLADITGSWQGGKGINLTLIWISFCFVFPALRSLGFSGWKLWFLSAVTALNPVAVYQISCFQIDGQLASLVTCLLFSMLGILASGSLRLDWVLALLISFVGSAASKTSGVFYAIIISVIFFIFLAAIQRSWKKLLLLGGLASAIIWPLGILIRSTGQFPPLTLEYLKTATGNGPGYGVGGGASQIREMQDLNRIQKFLASSCAYTEIMPTKVNLKPPFWMQRRELRAIEDLTPDPRAGGFGPLFSTGLVLAGAGCLLLVMRGNCAYWPGWFLFLASAVSSFSSQVWWARWTPQSWLLLIAMVMSILACSFGGLKAQGVMGAKKEGAEDPEVGWARVGIWLLGGLASMAVGLNVFLVALYYFVGMFKHERILDRQIELAALLGVPVPIHIEVMQGGHYAGSSFLATEWWFVDRGIPFKKLPEKPVRPRMKIHKTETRFPLPADWRLKLENPEEEAFFRKKGLIED